MSKTKQNKKFNIYISIISLLLAWVAITIFLVITKYDILPFKYLMLIFIILIIIPGLLIFFMLKRKTKTKTKCILSVVSIIITIVLAVILSYLNKTFKFLSQLNEVGYKTENYSVIVLNDNNYTNIEDINNKTVGYYHQETSKTEQAVNILEQKITINKNNKDSYITLIECLYNGESDAIIIEESYRSIIEENDEIFSTKTKVIYTIEIKTETEDITKNVNVNKETFNIYISGIDTYGNISSVSRSDVNIIATINPTTHQILLTTIPRDYYVQLDGTTGYKDKLTHAGIYGIEKSIKTLENLLDIEINYYVKVNFSSVEKIVEALGGVDVYSKYTFTGANGTNFVKGYNRVNGKQALEFARTRKTISGGDRTRGENQQALIQAMINKACSKEIINKYTNILNSLEGSFQTNMSIDKITDVIKKQIDEMKPWNTTSISLDGSNGREYTYSYPHQTLYVMIPNETTVLNAKEKINKVINGETLESSYQENNSVVNTPTISTPTTGTNIQKEETQTKEENITENDGQNNANIETNLPNNQENITTPTPEQPEEDKNNNVDENNTVDENKSPADNNNSITDQTQENETPKETETTDKVEQNTSNNTDSANNIENNNSNSESDTSVPESTTETSDNENKQINNIEQNNN